jgi:hypothetical protein
MSAINASSEKNQAWSGNPHEIWTNDPKDKRYLHNRTQLPAGLSGGACPKCGSHELTGAVVTETADEMDPDLLCCICGYWWD